MKLSVKDNKKGSYEVKINFQDEEKEKEQNIIKNDTIEVLEKRYKKEGESMPDGSYTYTFKSKDPEKVIAILVGVLNAIGVLKKEEDLIDMALEENEFKSQVIEYYKNFWIHEN